MKINGSLIHVTTWMNMNFTNIMLNKMSQTKKYIIYDSTYIKF